MPIESPPVESFWLSETGSTLFQGELLPSCPVFEYPDDFGRPGAEYAVGVKHLDLIVVTQSCDLENQKVKSAAACPVLRLEELKATNDLFGRIDRLEEVRKGRFEALHMLSSPDRPDDPWSALVVDFREIHSLPITFLAAHAVRLGPRWRLKPAYLEHFSQAFARFFMRVGLPSSIPRFKK